MCLEQNSDVVPDQPHLLGPRPFQTSLGKPACCLRPDEGRASAKRGFRAQTVLKHQSLRRISSNGPHRSSIAAPAADEQAKRGVTGVVRRGLTSTLARFHPFASQATRSSSSCDVHPIPSRDPSVRTTEQHAGTPSRHSRPLALPAKRRRVQASRRLRISSRIPVRARQKT
ncbi:hypothetical protein K466DRAFT_129500 [Polyporus arcularius HHB13444]|uniref:Uncharacterized protein n=1 Tax=Polyporus arcularius HHB13444 TaxID=1314778 RepID=A0A5C3PZ55_9APHY|nr:hypothetical protein K466DRAFT_129500 [Polyporus arcularius HHB13444]